MAMFTALQTFKLPSSGDLKDTWTNQVIGPSFYYTFTQALDPVSDLENCLMCDIVDNIYFNLDQIPANNNYTEADAQSWGNLQVANAAWNSISSIGLQSVHYPDTGLYVGAPVTGNWQTTGSIKAIAAPVWANGTAFAKSYMLNATSFIYVEIDSLSNGTGTVTKLVKVSVCGGCTTSNIDVIVPSDVEGWARNTGTVSDGSERAATNLDKGEPTEGFEASLLKWWASPDKNLGSYIVKENPDGQSGADGTIAYVGFWRPESETDGAFITLVERLSGESHETVENAKTWLTANGYSTTYNEKSIATEFFYFDPGSPISTMGTKSSPTNVNSNNYNGTIFDISPANGTYNYSASINRNGVIYDIDYSGLASKDEYGYVRMDGTGTGKYVSPKLNSNSLPLNQTHEDQPELSGLGDTHTVEIWFRSNTVNSCIFRDVDKWSNGDWEYHFAGAQLLQVGPFQQVIVNLWNGTECERVVAGSGKFDDGQWHQLVRTYDGTTLKCYLDGVAGGTLNMTFYSPMDMYGYGVGTGWYWEAGLSDITTYNNSTANAFNGDYGIFRGWTRALTAAEVAQNFEADRAKYGI